MNKTGDRIRAKRIALGLSQEELASRVGLKKAAINKYESGVVVNLKRSMIDKLAEALDVSPVYLLGLEDRGADSENITEAQFALIQAVKQMTDEQAAAILTLARQLSDPHKAPGD